MHNKNRTTLLQNLALTAGEVYGNPLNDERSKELEQRLTALLDAYLLQSQPIVQTEATILLADIRGFTSMTRSLDPATTSDLLNRYFLVVSEVVQRYDGIIDKFMGDSVMALFGAPERQSDDLERAVCCAIEIQNALHAMNEDNQAADLPQLFAGIAIHSGEVMAGTFGSDIYSEYTVIGDTANLAARIESFCLRGQVLLSEAAREGAAANAVLGTSNEVRVKGFTETIRLHELRGYTGEDSTLTVPDVEMRRSPRIAVDLDAIFRHVRDKKVESTHFSGRIHDIGYSGICADLPLTLPPYSEVAMTVQPQMGLEDSAEVYARVIRSRPEGQAYRTSMEFTTVDTPAHRQLKDFVDFNLWHR
ncbi:MAG: adenylate/guanylate cyclase domain-containing protein [Pseudomonadota bacterium]